MLRFASQHAREIMQKRCTGGQGGGVGRGAANRRRPATSMSGSGSGIGGRRAWCTGLPPLPQPLSAGGMGAGRRVKDAGRAQAGAAGACGVSRLT